MQHTTRAVANHCNKEPFFDAPRITPTLEPMPDTIETTDLDSIPNADTIAELRTRASEKGQSVGVTFPSPEGERKRLVVSPRGTSVLLNDVSEETFNRSVEADAIADALRS